MAPVKNPWLRFALCLLVAVDIAVPPSAGGWKLAAILVDAAILYALTQVPDPSQ